MTEVGFFKPGDTDLVDPDQACHAPGNGFAPIGIEQPGIAIATMRAASHAADTEGDQPAGGDSAQVAQPVTGPIRLETGRRRGVHGDEGCIDLVSDFETGLRNTRTDPRQQIRAGRLHRRQG